MKLFEIRDRHTFIPVFAFRARPAPGSEPERYLLARSGYGPTGESACVIVGRLDCRGCHYDPHEWLTGARTMPAAHQYIEENFDGLETGAVIDVEFILGESPAPKISESVTWLDHP